MIFDSLGSGYSLDFALRFLRASASAAADRDLKELLSQRYSGQAWLYFRGRAALCEAVRLCKADSVITSGFSCYVVEEAIVAAGGRPIFADMDERSFNSGFDQLRAAHEANKSAGAVFCKVLSVSASK